LTEKQDSFLHEARDVLRAGLETSSWVSPNPGKGCRLALRARLDRIFRRRTGFVTLV
jgi:hypothetical protein